tara:strand:+ start:669 stop:1328 length:660 start_codon:yes stop_codon:yes gene_type:complete
MNEDILHLGYLTLRLSREKQRQKIGEEEVKSRIYLLHINGNINLKIEEDDHITYNKKGIVNSAPKIAPSEYPSWAKKLEREIAKKTHPDKLSGLSESEIEEKTEIFLKAKDKIKNKKFIDLLPIALSLGIDFSKYSTNFKSDIVNRIREIQIEINEIQNTIYWQWESYNEDQKIQAINLILERSGIKRSKEDIKKAVNKRIKRKTGTRPKTLKEIRGLK